MRAVRVAVRAVAMALAAGWATGCADVGLPGNLPRAEAENRQFRYSVYEMTEGAGPDAGVLSFEGRNWMPSAATIPVPDRLMQPVGTVGGIELFAPAWVSAPHARLYARGGTGRWHPVAPGL